MIGQKKNKLIIDDWAKKNKFPKFIIITGAIGSGKRTLVKYITDKMNRQVINCGLSVDDVREVISQAYTLTIPTVFIFADAHKMSAQAKNALLKVTEESPNDAMFILTSVSIEQLLPTLESRCVLLEIEIYEDSELYELWPDENVKYACYPGDIEKLKSINISALENLCSDIIKLTKSMSYEAFVLLGDIKFSNNDKGIFDLSLVMNVLNDMLISEYEKSKNITYLLMRDRVSRSFYSLNHYNILDYAEFINMLISFYEIQKLCA